MVDTADQRQRVQSEITRLRIALEPEMLKHDIRLPRPGDVPTLDSMVKADSTTNDRVATTVTRAAGSVWFAYIVLSLAAMWIAYNVYVEAHGGTPADEPWSFPTMLLVSNFVQLLMPIFILVSQGRAERRDRAREERDHLLTLIGRRDVLLLFTYLSEFAEQQRTMTLQQKTSQDKLFVLEREQNHLSGELVPGLISLIRGLSSTLEGRPCILDRADAETLDYVNNRIRERDNGPHADDLGEGQGHPGVERVADPE